MIWIYCKSWIFQAGNLVAMLWNEFIRGRTIPYFSFFFGTRNSIERISCIFPAIEKKRAIPIFEIYEKK